MSSTTGLSRTRSIRQPATSRNQSTQKDDPPTRNAARNPSPSRLPQVKPLTRSATTTAASSASAAARSRAGSTVTASTTTTASGRSLAGLFSGKTPGAARRANPTAPDDAPAHAPLPSRPLGRAPSIRQLRAREPASTTSSTTTSTTTATTSAGVSRRVPSAGVKRPTSSGGLPSPTAPKSRPLGHARAKSTATALSAATTLRPPVSNAPPSPKTTSISTPTRPRTNTLLSSHTRNSSQSTTTATTATQAPSAAAPAAAVAPPRRPTFNTNQQHYSPLKSHAPKPLTASYLAPPSPSKLPANLAISAETSRLQTELLQLSLIHREAGAVARQWHDSARRKLGARFRRVAREHDDFCVEERDGVEGRNAAALVRWGSVNSISAKSGGEATAGGLEDKIQVLDQVLDGVWALSEPGGRYNRVVEDFETWAERMAGVVRARKSGKAEEHLVRDGEILFVSDLDTRWKDDCAGLVRKLEGWRGMLDGIGPAPGDVEDRAQRSSLSRALGGSTSLVDDMLAEMELMQDIEKEARRSEDEWIERMNKELEIGDHETLDREASLWKMII
ncbi:hypothetical protein TruAng_006181 [Truncatella angustata]|nr:hypothetical protein TruAng_006181 [Truncatella angustata]